MIKNYFIVAIRNLMRQKIYSVITVLSLAIGIACSILVLLFVQDEFKHATYHANAHRIFKLWGERTLLTGERSMKEWHKGELALAIRGQFPEIEIVGRTDGSHFTRNWIRAGDKLFKGFCSTADSDFLDMFHYPMVRGGLTEALAQPGSAVLSERAVKTLFGDEDPVGKVVTHVAFDMDFRVTGVLQDMPRYVHLRLDFLTSPYPSQPSRNFQNVWDNWNKIYLQLAEGHSHVELEQKLSDLYSTYVQEENAKVIPHLSPISREYLYGDSGGPPRIGQIYYLVIFGAVVLIVACVNFVNLATARSRDRAKEVGVRKVVGAFRKQLAFQFIGESVLLAFIALVLACGLVSLVLPTFNELMTSFKSEDMDLSLVSGYPVFLSLIGFVLMVGLLAGSYPALILSAFHPVDTLKGRLGASSKGTGFRKGLIVFQFAVSIGLILCTVVINNQMQFVKNRDLGFDKDVVVLSPIFNTDPSLRKQADAIKRSFLQHPDILSVSTPKHVPPEVKAPSPVYPGGDPDGEYQAVVVGVDEHYMDTFGMTVVVGRNFDARIASDSTEAVLVNETAVEIFGWEDPIGQTIDYKNKSGRVIGVVKDFHYNTLHHPIGPALLHYELGSGGFSFRINAQNIPETMDFMRDTWSAWVPHRPPRFQFLRGWIDFNYTDDHRMSDVLNLVSIVAIAVACLGLFGLASFSVAQRTKEVGIRKVLGASVSHLLFLLSKDFIKLVLIANLITWPLVYYVMRAWLQNYAYRIELEVWVFVAGGLISLILALITVSSHTLKSATTNPVDVLRDE